MNNEIKRKRGRPATKMGEDVRNKQFLILMSSSEIEKLERVSKQTGLTKADLIRKSLDSTYNIIDLLGEKKGE